MLKIGKISSVEGDNYKVVFKDADDIVTMPLPRIIDMTKVELTPGEQSLTYEQEKFKVDDSVLAAFVDDGMQSGVIIGKVNDNR